MKKKDKKNKQPITGGLAQAGRWLARKFVVIWKFIARPSVSGSPACPKPLGRCTQAGATVQRKKNEININRLTRR